MKTYWDHTEQERSLLTDDDVKLMLDVELMKAGVRKPIAPTLKEVPKSPLGEKKRYYGIEGKTKYGSDSAIGVVFPTAEAAQAFIDLNPLRSDYDYEIGSEFRYSIALQDAKIVSEELYSMEQINEFRSSLKHRKSLSEENQRLQSKFTEESNKAEKITDGVWADYYKCQSKSKELEAIIETYKKYLSLTKGDVDMALTFLYKVNSLTEVNEAREWFPDSIPTAPEPQPA